MTEKRPKNVLEKDMWEAVLKLERLGDDTRAYFERDHKHESWFGEWNALAESGSTTKADDDDTSLWHESDDYRSEL